MGIHVLTPRQREIRGLVRHIRRLYGDPEARPPGDGRDLIGKLRAGPEDPPGVCVWCGTRTGRRARWHDDCGRAHTAARGQTIAGGIFLLTPRGPCEECTRPGVEVDHRIALGVARRLWRPWVVVRAWSRGNLRNLCRDHHILKTREDLAIMRALDANARLARGPTLFPDAPKPATPY